MGAVSAGRVVDLTAGAEEVGRAVDSDLAGWAAEAVVAAPVA